MTDQLIRKLIRCDGSVRALHGRTSIRTICKLIEADDVDTVSLRHLGEPLHVMVVDGDGLAKGLPLNAEATRLYWANCRPGCPHAIVGDVVVVPDVDYAQDDARWPLGAACSTEATPPS